MNIIKKVLSLYLIIGASLGLGTGLSYVLMPWKLAFDGCYGLWGFLIAKFWGVLYGILGYVIKMVAWPYGLYVTYVNDLSYMRWIFPGFYAGCAAQ